MTNLISIAGLRQVQVGPVIALALAAVGALQIDDDVDARIHPAHVIGPAGFQQHGAARVGQSRHQREDFVLQERFAAGDFHQRAGEPLHLRGRFLQRSAARPG